MTSDPSLSSAPRRLWRVGTLTYTTGGLIVLFCWLFWGDFAWSLKDRFVPAAYQVMLKQYKAGDMFIGLLTTSLPAAIMLILGPIITVRSDRHRGNWGRRIPYIALPIPGIVLAMIGLAFSPEVGTFLHHALGKSSPGLTFCILAVLGVCWGIFEVGSIVANSVLGGLVNDVVPAAIIGRFFAGFRILSLGAGILVNYCFLGYTETHYRVLFLAVSLIYGASLTLMCLKVREGEYPPPPPVASRQGGGLAQCWEGIRRYIRECFGHPFYLCFFALTALIAFTTAPFGIYGFFYAKALGMSTDQYGKCTAYMYVASFLLSYPLGMLADRYHPLRVGLVVLVFFFLIYVWSVFFLFTAGTFAVTYIVTGVLNGAWLTSTASLGQRLLPRDKFGQYSSANGMVSSLGIMVLAPMLAGALNLAGYVQEKSRAVVEHAPQIASGLNPDAGKYRCLIYISLAFCCLTIGVGILLYRRFQALGGNAGYVAPVE